MASDNSVTIVGNLVDDPELRFTRTGQAMARLRLAHSRRWQNRQSGQWEEESHFFTVTAWRDLAENAASSLKKGMRIVVTGTLRQRSWETDSGDKRSVVEIQADELGPSLRWATAEVQKVRREAGSGGGPGSATAAQGGDAGGGIDEQPWDEEPAF
ncbi:MAG: single-stranded DNA-binding protein [Acidimicrobiia bacterium]